MKKYILFLLLLLPALALAQPELSISMNGAGDHFSFDFTASEGGTLALQLMNSDADVYDIGSISINAGMGSFIWDGILADGRMVPENTYTFRAQLRNFWGETSEMQTLVLSAGGTSVPEEAPPAVSTVPYATSFWDMDPDAYDLTNPEHQQAIWDLMMQPITVLDVGQTEHVYPTNQPGISIRPYEENTAGELHGQSQGVHVLEEDLDKDGYLLIEAYSNDGTKTDNSYMESIDNKRISGYVKSRLLKTVKPSSKYALLIDKLRQKLYIFENGAIIGTLSVSTGLNNPKQPYNETPAGEYITVSKVGEFVSGTMRAQYAIRINGGTLLHEVPYRLGGDKKTKIYSEFEPALGQKASHGCIRIQRTKNSEGQNMLWLWNNLENNTRVFVWDDQGRPMYKPEVPDASLPLYRNPNGGSNYHLDANCSGVKSKFLPLTGDFTYGDLVTDEFSKMTPCIYCGAPARPEILFEKYKAEADELNITLPEDIRSKFYLSN